MTLLSEFGNMQLNVISHNDGQYVSEKELISKSLCKETVRKALLWVGKKDVVLKDQKELSDELLRCANKEKLVFPWSQLDGLYLLQVRVGGP